LHQEEGEEEEEENRATFCLIFALDCGCNCLPE
jgi:hypothetical protein